MKKTITFAILISCCLPASPLFAHGNQATNENRYANESSVSFWEYLLSSAHAAMTMTIKNGYRYINSDSLADHATGQFPNSGNPHRIQSKNITYRVPLNPVKSSGSQPIGHSAFGVAINGVAFDPATAEYWNNDRRSDWNIEAMTGGINLGLDLNNAHVQPDGSYHYHALPIGIVKRYDYRNRPALIGYAADGFPIYTPYGYKDAGNSSSPMVKLQSSYRIKSGIRPDGPGGRYDGTYSRDFQYVSRSGDLDACNGRTGVTPEYPDGTYYYVITDEFPIIPRCWAGTDPDRSFQKSGQRGGDHSGPAGKRPRDGVPGGFGRGPSQGPNPGGQPQGPPPEAFTACKGHSEGSSCEVNTPRGALSGNCRTMMRGEFVCVPANHRPPR